MIDLNARLDIAKNQGGAYDVGIEYVYIMVHGAAPTRFLDYTVPSSVAGR